MKNQGLHGLRVSPDLNFEKLRIKKHKPNSVILLLSFRITKILKLQKNRTLQFDSIWGELRVSFLNLSIDFNVNKHNLLSLLDLAKLD